MSYSDIAKRLKIAFSDTKGFQIAQQLGLSKAMISKYLTGKNMPKYEVLIKISEITGYTTDWILKGEGPEKIMNNFMLAEDRAVYAPGSGLTIITREEWKEKFKDSAPNEPYFSIPLISDPVAAGDPINVNEQDIEGFAVIYDRWLKPGHEYRCVRIKGNSMYPILEDGFIVAIDCSENQPRQLNGKMIAARYQNGVTVKWLITTNENYTLLPQNIAEYQPIIIPIAESNPIIGKIAWWWGRTKD